MQAAAHADAATAWHRGRAARDTRTLHVALLLDLDLGQAGLVENVGERRGSGRVRSSLALAAVTVFFAGMIGSTLSCLSRMLCDGVERQFVAMRRRSRRSRRSATGET